MPCLSADCQAHPQYRSSDFTMSEPKPKVHAKCGLAGPRTAETRPPFWATMFATVRKCLRPGRGYKML